MARFINEDTYEGEITNPFSLNLYTYVVNNPLIYSDPTGNMHIDIGGGKSREPITIESGWMGSLNEYAISELAGIQSALNDANFLRINYPKAYAKQKYKIEYYEQLRSEVLNNVCSYANCSEGASWLSDNNGLPSFQQTENGEKKNYTITAIGIVSCNCFTAGTIVLTEDGEKAIEDITVGDKVLAKDDQTGDVAYKEVRGLFQKQADQIYYITVEKEIIEVTEEHPFWIDGAGWTKVRDMKIGDLLVTSDGTKKAVEQIRKATVTSTVYNFEVQDYNSYFVTNLGIWVHNCTVTESMIRGALANADLKSQQKAVSLPMIQRYVNMALSGQKAPPIHVDDGVLVDGYHRYIAGLIIGQIPAYRPYSGARPDLAVPWNSLKIDPEDWDNK
ncbi:Hint domain-containing protein [Paenibacillus sp. GSMTC-2017]|nr:Hint domain-containing protein [Paenibacillus sp. GSMTC-2017]